MITNHWGIWVDSDKPITGVISNNDIQQFISDEMYNGIDLSYEEFLVDLRKQYHPNSNAYKRAIEEYNENDWDSSGDYLIGDWIKDKNGLYDYDPKGEYAAIVREDVTQVVFSKYTTRARLCSPCYPGQADVDPDDPGGNYLAFTLPPGAFDT